MANLRIRIYNVLFGDAILLTIPEKDAQGNEITVNVLIDVGNALAGQGGRDEVFKGVLENIQAELKGQPLDLYIMTHEHMDHVQGLQFGAAKLGIEFKAKNVWMTASSAPDYYDTHPKSKQKKLAAMAAYDNIAAFLAMSAAPVPLGIQALLEINNPHSSKDCVDYISKRKSDGSKPLYVHRQTGIDSQHPFRKTKVRILAPEEDTSIYYGALPPQTMAALAGGVALTATNGQAITPPAGVSAGHFFDLIEFRASGMTANLRSIDKAANNSSIAFELEWNGWKLLFPGDAEEKSWEMMDRTNELTPVHFLKISHHGSPNGSPSRQIDKVLPPDSVDGRQRLAAVSTRAGAYNGVPNEDKLILIGKRVRLADTRTLGEAGWFDISFPDDFDATPELSMGP
jgi:hypothetical protein